MHGHYHIRCRRQVFMMMEAAIQVAEWLNKDVSKQAKVQHPI